MKNWIDILLKTNDTDAKDELILDIGNSVRSYIKTGNATELLNYIFTQEEKIEGYYKELAEMNDLLGYISDDILSPLYKSKETISEEEIERKLYEVSTELKELLDAYSKKMAYLNYLKMFYTLCSQETRILKEKEMFKEDSLHFSKLFTIATKVSISRHITKNELMNQCYLTEKDYLLMSTKYLKYFNIHRRNSTLSPLISLTLLGRQYVSVMNDEYTNISYEEIEKNIVRNCESLIKAMHCTMVKKIPCSVELYGLLPENKRNIQFTYNQLIYDYNRMNTQPYTVEYYESKNKEISYGKNEYTLHKWSDRYGHTFKPVP